MKKILFHQEPCIKPYPITAGMLSIMGQYDKYMLWYFENATNFFSKKNDGYTDFFTEPLRKNPFLEWQGLSRNTIQKYNIDILDLIKNAIEDECYIFISLDHFHLPCSKAYQKYSFMHDVMIHGYDEVQEKLYVGDFFQHSYTFETITFEKFLLSFQSQNYSEKYEIPCQSFVYLIKTTDVPSYRLNIKKVSSRLKDYLNSSNDVGEFFHIDYIENKDIYLFGISCYNNFIRCLTEKVPHQYSLDLRQYYMIYSHKFILKMMLEYLKDEGYGNLLLAQANQVLNQSKVLLNKAIKYNLTHHKNLSDQIMNELTHLKACDSHLILNIVMFLEDNLA